MDQVLSVKNEVETGETREKLRILVAPLDWGLGHATRCIPIIRELLAQGCEVFLAGEGAQEVLLKNEFPELPFLSLPGYRIRYARTKNGLIWKMIQQGPKIRRAILYEHQWLKKMVVLHHLDAVISDNRYGLYHDKIPCVFITHQLLIKSAAGKWTEKILQKKNYKYINRFTECWVPDIEEANNWSGDLSHPFNKPLVPLHYIGLLSRFSKPPALPDEKKDHLLILLSGPEPQRSMLEEKLIHDASQFNGTAVIVRGLPGHASFLPSTGMINVFNHLPAEALQKQIEEAEYVISRSGYSTVMDLAALQKKSILIPTPGQTEQEYLGQWLEKKQFGISFSQREFSLTTALEKAGRFPYKFYDTNSVQNLKKTIERFLYQSCPALG